jgi:hypothetical protein
MRLALARVPPVRSSVHSIHNPRSLSLQHWSRAFSSKPAEEKPKGLPYSKLIVGIPKETFPLEKRVAATPEVSALSFWFHNFWSYFFNRRDFIILLLITIEKTKP